MSRKQFQNDTGTHNNCELCYLQRVMPDDELEKEVDKAYTVAKEATDHFKALQSQSGCADSRVSNRELNNADDERKATVKQFRQLRFTLLRRKEQLDDRQKLALADLDVILTGSVNSHVRSIYEERRRGAVAQG
jgi:hypothetical protein